MTVNLFINYSDKKTVSKSLTALSSYECTLKDSCSILTPTLYIVDYTADLYRANYAYIPQYGRYYYVEITETPNMIQLDCVNDPLMSFNGSINGLNTYVVRQEYLYNMYIADSMLPVRVNRALSYLAIGNLGNDTSIILTVTGTGG